MSQRETFLLSIVVAAAQFASWGSPAENGPKGRRISFRLSGNRISLDVRVNESKPLTFVLDTGASATILDTEQAKRLRLPTEKVPDPNAPSDLRRVQGLRLRVGGLDLTGQSVLVRDLDAAQLPHSGQHLHGVLGLDFFNRFVTEIDYRGQVLTLYDPKSYEYRGAGEIIPLVVARVPFARVKIAIAGTETVERLVLVDTGSNAAINVETDQFPTTTIEQEQVDLTNNITTVIKATFGRASSVQFGRFVLSNPVVGVTREFTMPGFPRTIKGIVGGGLLRRFKVIVDYQRRRMILEPVAPLQDSFDFDMSGMWILSDMPRSTSFKVTSVMPNGPAAAAGLRVGDLILSIDGRPADKLTLEQVTLDFFRREGRRYKLSIRRGGATFPVNVVLRRLI